MSTYLIIPSIVKNIDSVHSLTEKLSHHYITNGDSCEKFIVIASFPDGCLYDDSLLFCMKESFKLLNDKYCTDRFSFVWRRSAHYQGVIRAYERKRGAVMEFCDFLRTGNIQPYVYVYPGLNRSERVKYVMVLDSDTVISRGCVRGLSEVLDNNRAVISGGRVLSGYGIAQPVVRSLKVDKNPFLSALNGSEYSLYRDSVCKDVTSTPTFYGKGLIDVDAYNQVMSDKIPDNSVLSHDIIEGIYLNCITVGKCLAFDSNPSTISGSLRRLDRWFRGDILNIIYALRTTTLSVKDKRTIFSVVRPAVLNVLYCICLIFLFCTAFVQGFGYVVAVGAVAAVAPIRYKGLIRWVLCPLCAILFVRAVICSVYYYLFDKGNVLKWRV